MKRLLLFSIFFISLFGFSQNRIKSIYFEIDQSIPTPYSQNQLKLFKESYQNEDFTIIEICAYTDSIGSREHNDSLAKKRLRYVAENLNIPPNTTIKLLPFGIDRKYDVKNAKSWRRVDIYYSTSNETSEQYINSAIDDTYILMKDEFIGENLDSTYLSLTNKNIDITVPFILNVEFLEGTAKMDEKSQRELFKFYEYLLENPSIHGTIRGHVCCGNNMRISKMRARTVYKELIKLGIHKNRLDYVGMSNKEPLVFPEKTNQDRQRNRRVDVKLVKTN